MGERTIYFDSSTDGGASLRHADRLAECCARLFAGGIAVDDLHKWADVLDLRLATPSTQHTDPDHGGRG